ncbi:DNA-directed RNA polymerase sigma-70 factor [Adhaeribacter aerolatus]|uniref:DNA-directed RNA polymerase sigma-70 factor n=1 Tax=Adhaeribacter aerolatus TaxID=670289 RepID=A0A512B4C1_9BACT|nr:sigma-70 family RNA polymerase sigma factor [Adhaeribacter aerolatus]GEO06782.1 DNA-directed RNA polymerase sigma-70 factor [Adhaeribacter aerolatus]
MSEPEIIKGLLKGEGKAQKFVYEKYAAIMLGICIRYLKNQMDAEEIMLNGFVRIFGNIGQFENKGSFEGWMKRIVINEALGFLRKKEPLHLAIEKEHIQVAADANAEMDLAVEDLLNLLHDLPAGYRTVFNLYAIEGYSHKEIAEMLDITEGTSKSQLSKARALLQKRLTGQEISTY